MAPIAVPGERLTGVNSQGETPTAKSLIDGARKAQKAPAVIIGEGGRRPGVNLQGESPTAKSLIDGARKAHVTVKPIITKIGERGQ